MKKFIMLIGIPGCGKTTMAKSLFKDSLIVSTDAIRGELFGDENMQGDPNKIFEIAKTRSVEALNGDFDTVVFDATNIHKKYRIHSINEIRKRVKSELSIIGLWIAVPYEICVERDKGRVKKVGDSVIKKMYTNFNPPGYEEGFDEISVYFNCNESDMAGYNLDSFIQKSIGFEQNNKYHSFTLGVHCLCTMNYVKEHNGNELLVRAALLHDFGKPFTASFKNHKGEVTEECHYYQHNCIGAYDSVFYTRDMWGFDDSDYSKPVYIANLIYYHMHPLVNWKGNEKKRKKDTEKMSEQFVKDLMLLNEADINAH